MNRRTPMPVRAFLFQACISSIMNGCPPKYAPMKRQGK